MAFGKSKSILGIDIGSSKTKIVQLAYSGKGMPEMTLCELLDTGSEDENFAAHFKAFLSDAKLKGSFAALSFDHPSMVIRKFEFPKMPEPDLIESMRWALRDHVDADVENYTIKYSKISEIEDQDSIKWECAVYAVDRIGVDDFKSRIEGFGLNVFTIEPSVVTLAAMLDRCIPDEENHIAGIDIGYRNTRFYVIGKRNFVFSRPVAGISLDDYEKSPDDFYQKLAIDIQKSIDTFQVNFKMQSIQSLSISGGGALVPDLDVYLRTNMGINVNRLNPFSVVAGAEGLPENLKPELFVQAVSLAMLQP